MTQLRDLVDTVLDNVQRLADQGPDRTIATTRINNAYREYVNKFRLNRLQVTTPGVSTSKPIYLIDTDLGITDLSSLTTIRYLPAGTTPGAGSTVEPVSYSAIADRIQPGLTTGYPYFYTWLRPNRLALYPQMSIGDQLEITYSAKVNPLQQDTDEPSLIDEAFHDLLELRATQRMAMGQDPYMSYLMTSMVQGREQEYARFLNESDAGRPKRLVAGLPGRFRRRGYHDPSTYFSGDN